VFLASHVRLQGTFFYPFYVCYFVTNATHGIVFVPFEFFHPAELCITQPFTILYTFAHHSFKLQTKGKSTIACSQKRNTSSTTITKPLKTNACGEQPHIKGLVLRQRSTLTSCRLKCVIPTICPTVIATYSSSMHQCFQQNH